MNAIISNRGKKKGKEIEVVIVHQSYVCYWYFNKLSIFREKFYGAWRFYEQLRSPDPMVKRGEEPVTKN